LSKRSFSDFEIFFSALLGLSMVLVGRRLLGWITADVGLDAFAPSLATRFGTSTTIANFSTFFVLLPTALAFIAIGIPFALRCLAAVFRRKIVRHELLGLLALTACVAGMAYEARLGSTGLISVAAIALVSLWQAWDALAARAARLGYWCLGGGALCLLGLAYYQSQYLAGAEASRFIAPTFLVVAFYLVGAGLVLTVPAAIGAHRSRLAAALVWIAVAAWVAAPRLRAQALEPAAADMLELSVAAGGAALMLAAALARQLRS
jgi:hypothetical protein